MNTSVSQDPAEREKTVSAMFAHLVIQHTNMALIFLGQSPHPQTGEIAQNLEHAQYFIDQLEMIAVKTKGNLDKQEDALLQQSLTTLRLAFVEAVSNPPLAPDSAEKPAPAVEAPTEPAPATADADADSHKKFSKKY